MNFESYDQNLGAFGTFFDISHVDNHAISDLYTFYFIFLPYRTV